MSTDKKQVSAWLTEAEAEAIRLEAEKEGRSVSQWLRQLIRARLGKTHA